MAVHASNQVLRWGSAYCAHCQTDRMGYWPRRTGWHWRCGTCHPVPALEQADTGPVPDIEPQAIRQYCEHDSRSPSWHALPESAREYWRAVARSEQPAPQTDRDRLERERLVPRTPESVGNGANEANAEAGKLLAELEAARERIAELERELGEAWTEVGDLREEAAEAGAAAWRVVYEEEAAIEGDYANDRGRPQPSDLRRVLRRMGERIEELERAESNAYLRGYREAAQPAQPAPINWDADSDALRARMHEVADDLDADAARLRDAANAAPIREPVAPAQPAQPAVDVEALAAKLNEWADSYPESPDAASCFESDYSKRLGLYVAQHVVDYLGSQPAQPTPEFTPELRERWAAALRDAYFLGGSLQWDDIISKVERDYWRRVADAAWKLAQEVTRG